MFTRAHIHARFAAAHLLHFLHNFFVFSLSSRSYTAACVSESESDGLEDFVVGDGQEESSISSGSSSSSEAENAMTLYRRQQNEELVVPGDESAYFESVHDAMEYSR